MAETRRVCRTCKAEKPIAEFRMRNDTGKRRGDCVDCERAGRKASRDPEKEHEWQRRYRERNPGVGSRTKAFYGYNAKSLNTATQNGQEWSSTEDRTVLRTDISVSEIAELVGRTYNAVTIRRSKLRRMMTMEGGRT